MSNEARTPDAEPFTARDVFPAGSQLLDKFDTSIQFFRTFLALAKGGQLWDKTPQELSSLKLMSAWRFNLVQSLFSAGVAAASVSVVGAALAIKDWDYSIADSFIVGLVIPVTLAVNAFVAAHAVVSDPLDREALNRSIRAALYFDGVSGLFTQTIGSILFAFFQALSNFFFWWLWISIMLFLPIQGYVTQIAIPKRLFRVNDGSFKVPPKRWFNFQVLTIISAACAIQVFTFSLDKVLDLVEFCKVIGTAFWQTFVR